MQYAGFTVFKQREYCQGAKKSKTVLRKKIFEAMAGINFLEAKRNNGRCGDMTTLSEMAYL